MAAYCPTTKGLPTFYRDFFLALFISTTPTPTIKNTATMHCFLIGCAHLLGLIGLYFLLSLLFKTHHPEMDDSSSSSLPQTPGAFPTLSPSTLSPMPPTSPSLGSLPSLVPQPTAPILIPRSPELDAKIAENASLKEQLRASRRENADLKNRRYNIDESRATARIVAAEKRADELTKQLQATSSLRAQLDCYKVALEESDRQRKAEQCVYRQSSERAAISHRQQIKALKIGKGDKTESSKLIEKISDLESDKKQLSKQNASKVKALKEEISAQQSTIDELKARNEQLVDRINEPRQADNTVARKDAETDELKKKVDNLQQFKRKLLENQSKSRASKKAQDEEISALKKVNAKLQQDLRAVNVSTSNVNCEHCTKKDLEIEALKTAFWKEVNDRNQKNFDELKKQYLQALDEVKNAGAKDINDLQLKQATEIQDLKTSNTTLSEQLEVQKRLTNEANSKVQQHEKTLQNVQNEAATFTESYNMQAEALSAKQQQIEQAKPIIQKQSKDLDGARIKIEALEINEEELKHQLATANEEVKTYKAQVYGLLLRCELAGISTDTDDNMTVDNNVDVGGTNTPIPGLNLTANHVANVEMTDTNQNNYTIDPRLLDTQFPNFPNQPLNPATSALMGNHMNEPMDTSSVPAQDNGDNLFNKLSNMQPLTPPNQSSFQPPNSFGSAFNQGLPSNPFAFGGQDPSTGGFTSGPGQSSGNFNVGQGQQLSGGLQFGQTQIFNTSAFDQEQPANDFTPARRLDSTRRPGAFRKSNVIKKPTAPAPPAPTLPAPSAPPANSTPKPERDESSYKFNASFNIPGLGLPPPSASSTNTTSGPVRPLKKPSCPPPPSARSANAAPTILQGPSGHQQGAFQTSNFGKPPQSAFLNIVSSAPRLKLQLPGGSNQQDDMETN